MGGFAANAPYQFGRRVRGAVTDIGSSLTRADEEAEARRRAEEQRVHEATAPIRALFAGLLGNDPGYGFERGERGSLVSNQPGEGVYAPSNEEIAELFKPVSREKGAGPATPDPEYRTMSPAEQEMEDRFQSYQADPEGFAAKRRAVPGELRFSIGKGPMQTYNVNDAGADQARGAEGSGFGQTWEPASGAGSFNVGVATPLARPELQGRADVAEGEERQKAVIANLTRDLEQQRKSRELERSMPLGDELPPLTGGEALSAQLHAATQNAEQQKKQYAFMKLQAAVRQLEEGRRRFAINPKDPSGISPEQYQNAHDALRFLYAAEIGDPRFLATKPREDFGIAPGAPQ